MKIYKLREYNYLANIFFFFLDRDFALLLVSNIENRFKKSKSYGFSGPYWTVRSVN